MKWLIPHIVRYGLAIIGGTSVSATADTHAETVAAPELAAELSTQPLGLDTATSEALLLVVFILLVLAVIAHRPKAP
jgi:hypothetical protein